MPSSGALINMGVGAIGPIQESVKTITLTGAAGLGAVGNITLLTATGRVGLRNISIFANALVQANTGTLQLLDSGGSSQFGITPAGDITANPTGYWNGSLPVNAGFRSTASISLFMQGYGSRGASDMVMNNAGDLHFVVAVVPITAGVLTISYEWYALTAGATLI